MNIVVLLALLISQSEETLLQTGARLVQQDKLAEAASVFEQCAQRYPGSFEAKYNLTLSRIGLAEYPAADKTLHSITTDSQRQSAAVEYLQGKLFAAEGRTAEARPHLEKAYRSQPGEENYALDLSLLYLRSSAYVSAIEVLQSSLASHPQSEDLALELALADALAGKPADATTVSQKLLTANPDLGAARLIAAFSACYAANYEDCKTQAAAGLNSTTPDPYLHYLYAEALWNTNQSDAVLKHLNLAIEKIPACAVCLLLRSRVEDMPSAIADVKAALAIDSQSGQAWYRLAELYRKSGEHDAAADALRHYRSLHETQTNAEIESFRKQMVKGDL